MPLEDQLKQLNACYDAIVFSSGKTLAEAWNTCEDPGWLLWLALRMAGVDGWPKRNTVMATGEEIVAMIKAVDPVAGKTADRHLDLAIGRDRCISDIACGCDPQDRVDLAEFVRGQLDVPPALP